MASEKPNPGIWIGAAIGLAALVVALSIPGKKPDAAPAAIVEGKRAETMPEPILPSPPAVVAPPPMTPKDSPAPTGNLPIATTAPLPKPPVTAAPPTSPLPPASQPAPPTAPPVVVSRQAVEAALDNIQFALRDFRASLGGNPVGNNAEITGALLGNNLKQLALPRPEGSSVNTNGELCDPWGTPYFFHQVSGTKMEIRSAGADRQMWTADDVQM